MVVKMRGMSVCMTALLVGMGYVGGHAALYSAWKATTSTVFTHAQHVIHTCSNFERTCDQWRLLTPGAPAAH